MSASSAVQHTYRYPYSSQLIDVDDVPLLQLATAQTHNAFPYFFEGRILQPRIAAQLLTTVAKVVGTRYYMPPNMLNRIIMERDPVVTAGAGMLRFEGFSACCSTYTRVDFSPDSYAGNIVGHGTTNVDFNKPMRAALARVRDNDRLQVNVGPDEIAIKRGFETVVERKVDLPIRWLKGFVEVQAYQSAMELRFDIARHEAVRFLRSLPRTAPNKVAFFVVPSAQGLRLSQIDSPEAVVFSGVKRLQLLTDLAPFADRLKIFSHPSRDSSEWQLQIGGIFISITVTADVSRGFSGEGQVLSDLSDADAERVSAIRAALKWQSQIDVNDIAKQTQLDDNTIRKGLALLGSRGVVGFDLNSRAYFHREMPFDIAVVEQMHPRLKNARRLLDEGRVKLLRSDGDTTELQINGTDVEHRVVLKPNSAQCTCPWHSKYQGARGPCKHILAAQLSVGDVVDDD